MTSASSAVPPVAGDGACLYVGRVMHLRLRPVRHRFAYRVFSLLLDLDRIDAALGGLRWLSYNRFNLLSFHDRDHGPRDGRPLRPWAAAELARAGLDLGGGPIRLLCFPRVLGYVFNPLSVYFCHHADGRLGAVIHQVHNTFGEQHCYVLPVDPARAPGTPVHQSCAKAFYVSPFIGMTACYRFRLHEPDARLSLSIREQVPEGELLVASLTGRRVALSDRALLRAFATHPLMTLKVIGAIHWEALRLWRKGVPCYRRPGASPGPRHGRSCA